MGCFIDRRVFTGTLAALVFTLIPGQALAHANPCAPLLSAFDTIDQAEKQDASCDTMTPSTAVDQLPPECLAELRKDTAAAQRVQAQLPASLPTRVSVCQAVGQRLALDAACAAAMPAASG